MPKEKTSPSNSSKIADQPSAGPDGISLTPPAYSHESIDQRVEIVTGPIAAENSTPEEEAPKKAKKPSGASIQKKAANSALSNNTQVVLGQERYVPHEAWHVVQQKQGRVKPMIQMAGIAANDSGDLETYANMMADRAFAGRVGLAQGKINPRPLQLKPFHQVVQRSLDENGYTMPEDEREDLDGFLTGNGFVMPFACTEANYAQLQLEHAALLNLIGEDDQVEVDSNEGLAYQALVDHANDVNLVAGNDGWNAAVTAGADGFEAAPGLGDLAAQNAAAQVVWPGRIDMPATFSAAVRAEIARRVAARQLAIANAYAAYNDGRLLPGTINAIRNNLGAVATLDQVNTRLALVYGRQCTVTRENWLIHLEIAGQAINGTPNLHFTTFNNSVASQADIQNLRVDQNDRNALCAELFINNTIHGQRLHATVVIGQDRFHRYWGDGPVLNQVALNGEYDRMRAFIHARVTAAINQHGRVGHNDHAQQLNIGP
jgi:hypothetical protein